MRMKELVGEAVRRSSISREDLRITSKLPGRYQTYDKAIPTIQESLYRANLIIMTYTLSIGRTLNKTSI